MFNRIDYDEVLALRKGMSGGGTEVLEEIVEESIDDVAKSRIKGGRQTATIIDYSYKFDRELANFNDGYEIRTTVDKDLILVQYSSDTPDASLCY